MPCRSARRGFDFVNANSPEAGDVRARRFSQREFLRDDVVAEVLNATGSGAHGVLVTAVSPSAFSQALNIVRRRGTISLVGLPPGEFATPVFGVVLKRITVRGSIVGTRRDLDEAIAFAADGKVRAKITKAPLGDINDIFANLRAGKIDGRVVLDLAEKPQ